jgi:HEAT repeat protein
MLTHEDPLSATQIVKLLGGATMLSRNSDLAAQRSAIANWSREGIPAKHWPALARIAAQRADTRHITIEALERHTFPLPSVPKASVTVGAL